MKLLILMHIFIFKAYSFEPHYTAQDVRNSKCFKEYLRVFSKDMNLEVVKNLKNPDLEKRPLLNKREYNLAMSAINGEGDFTFGEIFCKVQEDFNEIEMGEVIDWLRYGFVSGDFCPLFPFVSGYYNWESAYKYIVETKEKFNHNVPVFKRK